MTSEWKIVHWHVSAPESGIESGKVVPSKAGFKTELERWIYSFKLNPILNDLDKMDKLQSYLLDARKIMEESIESEF